MGYAGLANEYQNEQNDINGMNRDLINNAWGIEWGKTNIKKDKNGRIISFDYKKFIKDLFVAIENGQVNIKSQDNKYVTQKNLEKIIKQLDYFGGNR